jgi:hypothetical protein
VRRLAAEGWANAGAAHVSASNNHVAGLKDLAITVIGIVLANA